MKPNEDHDIASVAEKGNRHAPIHLTDTRWSQAYPVM